MLPTGSPHSSPANSTFKSARKEMSRLSRCARVGLSKTPSNCRSEPRNIAAAAKKNAAEEKSPGTLTSRARKCAGPLSLTTTRRPEGLGTGVIGQSVETSAPNHASMRSVWSRVCPRVSMTCVLPSAPRPASRTHDFTCALATGIS